MPSSVFFSPLIILIAFAIMTQQYTAKKGKKGEEEEESLDNMTFDWKTPYQPMTFDLLHRGNFNASKCNAEMMNCFEIISPTQVCTHNVSHFGSICSVMHEVCKDFNDDGDGGELKMREGYCRYRERYTRRFLGFHHDRTYDPLIVHLTE